MSVATDVSLCCCCWCAVAMSCQGPSPGECSYSVVVDEKSIHCPMLLLIPLSTGTGVNYRPHYRSLVSTGKYYLDSVSKNTVYTAPPLFVSGTLRINNIRAFVLSIWSTLTIHYIAPSCTSVDPGLLLRLLIFTCVCMCHSSMCTCMCVTVFIPGGIVPWWSRFGMSSITFLDFLLR